LQERSDAVLDGRRKISSDGFLQLNLVHDAGFLPETGSVQRIGSHAGRQYLADTPELLRHYSHRHSVILTVWLIAGACPFDVTHPRSRQAGFGQCAGPWSLRTSLGLRHNCAKIAKSAKTPLSASFWHGHSFAGQSEAGERPCRWVGQSGRCHSPKPQGGTHKKPGINLWNGTRESPRTFG
jgi:hypothetical protein